MAVPAFSRRSVIFTGVGLLLLGSAFYVQALSFTRFWQTAGLFAAGGLLLALAQIGQAQRRRLHSALREKKIPSAPLSDGAYLALLWLMAVMMVLPVLLWLLWPGSPRELDAWLGSLWLGWAGVVGVMTWLRWREAQMLESGARLIDPVA
ncbi:hypothetical protein [Brevundimonas viscosa]|uniref:Uncharacterized protein n=1 Tax=Brevundimonas viscosa TaxID=871741 RepID=A0A1I6TKQ2_9CAUL|nr:hypothetical protein [Brevundimonas viscosa]SFS89720.1 hypothetical protein SAMN05192570_0131 [Brevundimonas viscosa]